MKSRKQVIEELKAEKADLSEKIEKLIEFLHDEQKVNEVGPNHASLMRHQICYMVGYESFLKDRIKDLEKAE